MKKSELRKIIKEEIKRVLSEGTIDGYIEQIVEPTASNELKNIMGGDFKKLSAALDDLDQRVDGDEKLFRKIAKLDGYFPIMSAKAAFEYLGKYATLAKDAKILKLVQKYK